MKDAAEVLMVNWSPTDSAVNIREAGIKSNHLAEGTTEVDYPWLVSSPGGALQSFRSFLEALTEPRMVLLFESVAYPSHCTGYQIP